MKSRTRFEQRLHDAVTNLSKGEVVSFGDIANRAGRPAAARAAGRFLAQAVPGLPWWRVVYSDGRLPVCDPATQSRRLTAEGVELRGLRVVRSPLGRFET